MRHPITGCDAAQLFGAWAIIPAELEQMVGYAQTHPLPTPIAPAAESPENEPSDEAEARGGRNRDDAAPRKPYALDDSGIARLAIVGPMTKKRTSYQSLFGGTSTIALRNALREALHDDQVKAVLLEIDSPGGTVAGTNALADDIALLAAVKPLHAHVHDVMASAALWAGTQAGHISADPAATIGSIGVMARLVDTSGRYEAEKVKIHVITTGPYKGIGAPGAAVTPAHLAEVQREIDGIHAMFVAAISRGTGLSEKAVQIMADGRVHLASDARRMGLIDRVASLDDAIAHLNESISANRIGRGRAGRSSVTAATANPRYTTMDSLTPAQLALVQAVPGCTQATADTGFALLLSAASSNAKTAGEAATANTTLAQENDKLRKDNAELKAKSEPATPRELAMAQRQARTELTAISGKKLSPGCADAVAEALIGKDDAPVTAALTPDAGGNTLAAKVITALGKNEGVIAAGGEQKTNAQTVERHAPGAPDAKATSFQEGLDAAKAYQNSALAARGMS
jgi:signal peptide peptidase SppA